MIDNRTKYKISEIRKKLSYKEFYAWMKENKICPGCKTEHADNGYVKCSICRHNDRVYNRNRNRTSYTNKYYHENKDKILELRKTKYKDKVSEYMKKYYQEHKEVLKTRSKKYKMKIN